MDNKKRIVLISLIFCILFSSLFFVSAATNETEQVNQAYSWLSNAIRDNWQPLSVEENALSLLALSFDSALASQGQAALIEKSKNKEAECWPAASCKVKDTALATLALSKVCTDTTKSEEWLMAQNATPSDLIWYLQIDANGLTNCTVSYAEKEYSFSIAEDKKINKNAGSCLSLSYNSYWFKIASSCFDDTFIVSCDKDFIANLLYQKQGTSTIYVSSDTKKESAAGDASLKINSICLKEGISCNYESTALAAIALTGKKDINMFLPYLITYTDKNGKYLPEAYLLFLTGQQDYAIQLINIQKLEGYWQAPSTAYNRFYDTALALLALKDYSPEKVDKAKTWLLNQQVKTGNDAGSWQANKRDTAYILYSIWPKESTCISEQNLSCGDYGYSCSSSSDCDSIVSEYQCLGLEVCCKEKAKEKTCSEMGGEPECSEGYECNGVEKYASDGVCCLGQCIPSENGGSTVTNECEDNAYICKTECDSTTEQDAGYSCLGEEVCCSPLEQTKKSSKWWLIILIVVVLAALLFLLRGKIGGKSKPRPRFPPAQPPLAARPSMGPGTSAGPPVMPSRGRMPIMPNRSFIPRTSVRKTEADKEVDEALKKIKKITE